MAGAAQAQDLARSRLVALKTLRGVAASAPRIGAGGRLASVRARAACEATSAAISSSSRCSFCHGGRHEVREERTEPSRVLNSSSGGCPVTEAARSESVRP